MWWSREGVTLRLCAVMVTTMAERIAGLACDPETSEARSVLTLTPARTARLCTQSSVCSSETNFCPGRAVLSHNVRGVLGPGGGLMV